MGCFVGEEGVVVWGVVGGEFGVWGLVVLGGV